ncbi:MAG: hypothetical protein RML84_05130 [Anaerolineae bacterium]|nr:hypothetical protein [Anaerolineae bacterium]
MRRALPLLIALMLMFSAWLAESARDLLWAKFTAYTNPVLQLLPPAPPSRPLTQRLVLIWVRGLRLDAAQRMPTLNALRARGASLMVEHTAPTWRAPATFTLLSGARPETHGALLPDEAAGRGLDTLFHALQRAGRTAALVGESRWADWFEDAVPRLSLVAAEEVAARDDQAVTLALEALRDVEQPVAFVLVELALPEATLRTNPDAYATAVAATDVRVQQLVGALDLSKVTVAVLGDRGLDDRGRDGGSEPAIARAPAVIAGAGVRTNVAAIARAEDVAPTLAVLMGAAPPVHAQGRPLFEMLDASPEAMQAAAQQLTAFYEAWSELHARPRFAAPLLREYEAAIHQGDARAFQVWFVRLDRAAQAERDELRRAAQWIRVPLVIGIALTLAALVGAGAQAAGWASAAGGLAFVAVQVAFMLGDGSLPSFTLFEQGQPRALWMRLAPASAAGVLIASVLVAVLVHRRSPADVLLGVSGALALATLVSAAWALRLYLEWGDQWEGFLPPADDLAWALVGLNQIAAMNARVAADLPPLPLSILALALAAGVRVLIRRITPEDRRWRWR